jgi:hypothetical protein
VRKGEIGRKREMMHRDPRGEKKKERDWEKEGDWEREREKNMRMRDLIGREENGQLCGEENEKIEDLRVRDKMKR